MIMKVKPRIDNTIKTSIGIEKHTVVHMCKKCGKRKITRV